MHSLLGLSGKRIEIEQIWNQLDCQWDKLKVIIKMRILNLNRMRDMDQGSRKISRILILKVRLLLKKKMPKT
jgi:hypothetical protein